MKDFFRFQIPLVPFRLLRADCRFQSIESKFLALLEERLIIRITRLDYEFLPDQRPVLMMCFGTTSKPTRRVKALYGRQAGKAANKSSDPSLHPNMSCSYAALPTAISSGFNLSGNLALAAGFQLWPSLAAFNSISLARTGRGKMRNGGRCFSSRGALLYSARSIGIGSANRSGSGDSGARNSIIALLSVTQLTWIKRRQRIAVGINQYWRA